MCCDASRELHNVKLTNIPSCNVIKYTNLPSYWILVYDSWQNPREKKTINLKYHSILLTKFTWIICQAELSTAQISSPLLLYIFFQGTVEHKYE